MSKAPGYQALMAGLIAQGAKKLEANAAVVRCRAVDVDVTRAAIAEVEAKNPGLKLQLDTHEHLPPPPETSKEGASCAGASTSSPRTGRSCATTRWTTD